MRTSVVRASRLGSFTDRGIPRGVVIEQPSGARSLPFSGILRPRSERRRSLTPSIPPVDGDTVVLDAPQNWIGRILDQIVGFRSQLVRGMHRTHVLDVEGGGRIVDLTRELALSPAATDVGAKFARKPRGRLVLDEDVQPFGPSAPIQQFDLGGYKVDPKLDRAFSDTDL